MRHIPNTSCCLQHSFIEGLYLSSGRSAQPSKAHFKIGFSIIYVSSFPTDLHDIAQFPSLYPNSLSINSSSLWLHALKLFFEAHFEKTPLTQCLEKSTYYQHLHTKSNIFFPQIRYVPVILFYEFIITFEKINH